MRELENRSDFPCGIVGLRDHKGHGTSRLLDVQAGKERRLEARTLVRCAAGVRLERLDHAGLIGDR